MRKLRTAVHHKFPDFRFDVGTEVEVISDPGKVVFAGPKGGRRVADSPVRVRFPDGNEGWVSQSDLES